VVERTDAVKQFIKEVEDYYALHSESYKINVVTPHARKHGGPTTIINLANILQHLGHEVNLIVNYSDFNAQILKMCHTNIYTEWENPPNCDLMIINSDNPFAEEMMANQPDAKKIMLKLSHNARFKQIEEGNLRLPFWDHIMTSTNIMKDAAMRPHEGWRHQEWPDDKVTRIGWYHYNHPQFNCPPQNRTYGSLDTRIVIGTLIHAHPLKGTRLVMAVMEALKKKYKEKIVCIGVGEVAMKPRPQWLIYFQNSSRGEMASIFRQMDIWIGASHTEGLGRMPLEAMSSGAMVVNSNTGCEFLEHEKNCLLYPIDQAQECGNAVDRLIQDPDLRTILTLNGYQTACDVASSVDYVTAISNLINKVMK
jgi:glycosyltransferase involved in cell wall biosynthesis